jgi:spermidine dehydrogenase
MGKSDNQLGMDRLITRRDFVNGALATTAGTALIGPLSACGESSMDTPSVYPPRFTGMRGNHDSSFTVAHALGREGKTDWGPVSDVDEPYDLIVVGAGISGLAAATMYRKDHTDARILILDNHDDFGGHAKRNEIEIGGRILLSEGGSLELSEPHTYSDVVKEFLSGIGVNLERLESAYDYEFSRRHGLSRGFHFNKDAWGKSATVPLARLSRRRGGVGSKQEIMKTIDQFPMSENAKRELLHLYTIEEDQVSELSEAEKIAYFSKLSYRDFLTQHIGITEQAVFDFLQDEPGDMGLGIESTDTYMGMVYAGLPGWAATGLIEQEREQSRQHWFPDGNASLTRLMVRLLIPGIAPGNTMEDVVMARFDYAKLDLSASNARIRLNSTVINVANEEGGVTVSYVKGEKAYRVKAKNSVLACNNAMIPYLCPQLPQAQKEALADQVRQPILITCVAVKNWQAWKKLGLSRVTIPGGYHTSIRLQTPINIGDYRTADNPDEPIILRMSKYPYAKNSGLTAQEQYRAGRFELLATPFEEIERHIRTQLDELLGGHGFNAAEDIEAIIVNRWAHGYAYSSGFHNLFEDDHADPDHESYLHVQARKPMRRITIANSDSGGMAMLECAIDQAYRAVGELRDV